MGGILKNKLIIDVFLSKNLSRYIITDLNHFVYLLINIIGVQIFHLNQLKIKRLSYLVFFTSSWGKSSGESSLIFAVSGVKSHGPTGQIY
jgi:hypothetical protein